MESILFMIIVGIVSVLFKKSKGKQGQPKNKPFSTNTFEDIRTMVKKQLTYNENRKTVPMEVERKTEVILNNLENLDNKYLQLKQESKGTRVGITLAQARADSERVKKEQEDASDFHLVPDEKNLIISIIWSEILGEPRAKKPYRPRNG